MLLSISYCLKKCVPTVGSREGPAVRNLTPVFQKGMFL
uniref:Uncharacterized protein n=1 Tax=Rhizophora mucronata TaxID=61149 RepID=A0A2P2LN30_RHIMU